MYGEERVYWDAGAVFGLAYFLFVVPLAIGATLWFYRRRSVQPIKARSPELVVLTDIVLILYISLLCMQRVFANVYPCTLNLWSGYVGTLVLFNCYIWRCWTLYFRFRRAQAMEVTNQRTRARALRGADCRNEAHVELSIDCLLFLVVQH